MERVVLSSEIAGLDLRGAVTRFVGIQGIELSETVRRMEESIPQVIILLEAAVERCITFTGGSEADELILALDDIMLQYISSLQEVLKSLRVVCGVDVSTDGVGPKKDGGADRKDGASHARKVDFLSNEEEWAFVQGALQILTVADCLTSRSSVFEASLRATLARLSTNLSVAAFGSNLNQNQSHLASDARSSESSTAGRAALDVATLRLTDAPEKARKLFHLLEQVLLNILKASFFCKNSSRYFLLLLTIRKRFMCIIFNNQDFELDKVDVSPIITVSCRLKIPGFMHSHLLLNELQHLQMLSMSLSMMSLYQKYDNISMICVVCLSGLRWMNQLLFPSRVLVHTLNPMSPMWENIFLLYPNN